MLCYDMGTTGLCLGFGTMLGRLQLELVVCRRLPELLVALCHADEPWLTTRRVGRD
jgi:hypothetical protein